jgi:hypothetical protein
LLLNSNGIGFDGLGRVSRSCEYDWDDPTCCNDRQYASANRVAFHVGHLIPCLIATVA